MDPYQQLADALNRVSDEAGVEALSITFSSGDVPIDWNTETQKWEVADGEQTLRPVPPG